MGFISGLFGANNSNFQAQGPSAGDVAAANGQVGTTLQQQQQFVQALQGAGAQGLGAQTTAANVLSGVATGTGPNPAAAALNNATGTNVANTAALIAGARGASANPGLVAREAAQAGAGIQQQAVGQGAALQANQQIAGANALAGVGSNQVGETQSGLNAAAGTATAAQGNQLGAQANANNANASLAVQNAKSGQGLIGGVLGGVGAALNSLAKGGVVRRFADGGTVTGPQSKFGQIAAGVVGGMDSPGQVDPLESGLTKLGEGVGNAIAAPAQNDAIDLAGESLYGGFSKGGKVPVMLSPGEEYLDPAKAKKVAAGKASPVSGKMVPGRAPVKGDSPKNDIVPAQAEPGGVVIPRSIMESQGAEGHAARFVAAVLAKQGLKRKRAA